MTSLGINLDDYQAGVMDNNPMFSGSSQAELGELQKALSAGSLTGQGTNNNLNVSGASLKVESLDRSLKMLSFKESDIVLWKNTPKSPAYNTAEEFNQHVSYGTDRGGFYGEGQLPEEEDSTFVRRTRLVKYIGVTKSVTHQMMLVNTMVGSAMDRTTRDGMMWVLRKLNRGLAFADETIIPQEFSGLLAQHQRSDGNYATLEDYWNSGTVVDCRGKKLHEALIEDAMLNIIDNFGFGTDLYMPPKVLSEFVKTFYGNKFILPNTDQITAGIMGQRVQQFASSYGNITLNYDKFMKKMSARKNDGSTPGFAPTSSKAPLAPVAGGAPTAAVAPTQANSRWAASDADSYFYGVTGVNQYGESGLTILNSGGATAIAAGGAIDLQFMDGASPNPATGYIVYRSKKGDTTAATATYYPLFAISSAELAAGYDGAAATKVRDYNRYMPNCDQAFMIQNDDECWEFKQLAPLMKMDLAVTSPAYRFMVLLYGTPALFAPKKMTRFVNIGVDNP